MNDQDSRGDYQRRLHRVLAHIDAHLDAPLDLESLAAIAHFSPFHFHRVFAALIGETLGDYLRRRRVEVAAMRMVAQPRLGVLPAALGVGFGSGEAFTRAFKARFGQSPTAWRRAQAGANHKIDQLERNPDQMLTPRHGHGGGPFTAVEAPPMPVQLIDRAPVTIAYFRHTGPYGDSVGQFWQQIVAPWMHAHDLLSAPRYGISHDDPSITAPEKCRYDAAIEVPAGFKPTGQAQLTVIPGGRYACLAFEGTSATIGAAWSALLRDWIAPQGLRIDARPAFEYYPKGSRYDPATGVFDCLICVPVM